MPVGYIKYITDKIAAVSVDVGGIATDLGDFSAQSNLKSLLAVLGSGWNTDDKTVYAKLVTDLLAHGTHGLAIIAADTKYIADGALPASPTANSLARFIASGGTALGTQLAASKSLIDAIGHTGSAILGSGIGMELRRGTGTQIPDNKGIYDFLKYIHSVAIGTPTGDSIADEIQFLAHKALSSPAADSVGEKVTNIETDTEKLYDATFGVSPVDGSLASFIATGGTALGTRLPASTSLYDVTKYLHHVAIGTPTAYSIADILKISATEKLRDFIAKTGGTALPASKSLYDGLSGGISAVNRVAGKLQMATTTEDLNQVLGTYDLLTGTTQDVVLEKLIIRMPDAAAGGAITSISIQTDDSTAQTIISATDGVVANLTAEAQLSWTGAILIATGTKIRLTINGGAHGVPYVTTITAQCRAVVSGGYLA